MTCGDVVSGVRYVDEWRHVCVWSVENVQRELKGCQGHDVDTTKETRWGGASQITFSRVTFLMIWWTNYF